MNTPSPYGVSLRCKLNVRRKLCQDMARKRPLTRETVLQAALRLADDSGIESLSMRKLARELGVEAMSLYNHVTNKDDLLDGMVDLVFGEIGLPEPEEDWKTAMRQ